MATLTKVLRIGTWNIHEAVPIDQNLQATGKIRKEIVQLLTRFRLDIVALQEVDFNASSESPTLEAIEEHTLLKHSAHSILSESSFYPAGQAGVAIASRFPIKDVKRERFQNPELDGDMNGVPIRMFDKGYVSATIATDHEIISTVSLHAFPFHIFGRDAEDPAFAYIWSDLSENLAGLTLAPLIVCGDFNTNKRDLISGARLSLSRAVTHQTTYGNDSVDDMLFTSHFRLKRVEIVDNFSDHKLCFAELIWISKDSAK